MWDIEQQLHLWPGMPAKFESDNSSVNWYYVSCLATLHVHVNSSTLHDEPLVSTPRQLAQPYDAE